MVTQYVTLIDEACDELDSKVNAYLEEGWELYGAPYIYPSFDGNRPVFCQTVIKQQYRGGGIGGGR